jgi:hypothetical protein
MPALLRMPSIAGSAFFWRDASRNPDTAIKRNITMISIDLFLRIAFFFNNKLVVERSANDVTSDKLLQK